MPYLNPTVRDSGLAYAVTNGTRVDICSSEPATYAAIAGVSLGDAVLSFAAPTDHPVDGRRIISAAITGATVDASGTAAFFAVSDGTSLLIATNSLAASQAVVAGNEFNLGQIIISFRGAVSV